MYTDTIIFYFSEKLVLLTQRSPKSKPVSLGGRKMYFSKMHFGLQATFIYSTSYTQVIATAYLSDF